MGAATLQRKNITVLASIEAGTFIGQVEMENASLFTTPSRVADGWV